MGTPRTTVGTGFAAGSAAGVDAGHGIIDDGIVRKLRTRVRCVVFRPIE